MKSQRPTSQTDSRRQTLAAEEKSDAVRKLETMMADLVSVEDTSGPENERKRRKAKDKEPCFCQARLHPLSAYTPSCTACGLVLCSLHLPHLPCPSCDRPLLSNLAKQRVIARLQAELDGVLRAEAEERERIERAQRELALIESGGGAFPALGSGIKNTMASAATAANARKVLTIGNGAGRSGAKITTYTKAKVAEGVMPPKPSSNEPRVFRMPRPPTYHPLDAHEDTADELWKRDEEWRRSRGRPFAKMDAGVLEAIYVPLKETRHVDGDGDGGKSKKAKKGKGVGGAIVPGAE